MNWVEGTLKDGSSLKIDVEDLVRITNEGWSINSYEKRYPVCNKYIGKENGKSKFKKEYLHRLIANAEKGEEVDHINHDNFDCRKSNLRIVSRVQNMANIRCGVKGKKFKGVYLNKSRKLKKPYYAQIQNGKKRKHLGCFASDVEAAKAYDKAALENYGEFAKLNFPIQVVEV